MKKGQPPCSPHGWTLDTLEKHLSSQIDNLREAANERDERNKERFVAAEKATVASMQASEKALAESKAASEKRFDAVNEFRSALSDQSTLLLPRAEYEAKHKALEDKADDIGKRITTLEASALGKRESVSTIGAVVLGMVSAIAAAGTVISAFLLLMRH